MVVEIRQERLGKEENGFTLEEIAELRGRGYEILHKVGEGQTRQVYLARYRSGEVEKLRVIKPLKYEVDSGSICTLINTSKRDVNLAEVLASNQIQHPNIAEVVDNFRLNGRTVNVEAYYGGVDLEVLAQNHGPIVEAKRFRRVFGQVIDALVYLHNEGRILHRDIKPSNILVTDSGNVKITDLQNAAKRFVIEELSIPTRGGTPYTHPNLLNALVTDQPAKADERTELYALGATMFYALTGENPFDYNIVKDENGREIKIGNRTFKIKLTDGQRDLSRIAEEEHEARLRQAIRRVPKKYKNLVYRCLTTDSKKAFLGAGELRDYFNRVNSGFRERLKENIVRGAKIALPILTIGAFTTISIVGGIHASKQESKPTMAQILLRQDYRNFSLETLEGTERNYALDILVPYMENARKRLPTIRARKELPDLEQIATLSERVHLMDKRLVSSWLRACYLLQEHEETYKEQGEDRVAPSFVPRNFVLKNRTSDSYIFSDNEKIAQGVMYLKQCIGPERNVADVFANYFSSNEDINTARVRTRSINYFPRVNSEDHSLEMGYARFMPYHERELISTAVALYMITDEEGNIDFNKIPKLDFARGTYKQNLRLPEK